MTTFEPILIPAFNPGPLTGAGNNTYLVRGALNTLIDAGTGGTSHVEALEGALGFDGDRARVLNRVVITHAHHDHISGCAALGRRWPDAQFAKLPWPDEDARHPVKWRHLEDREEIQAGDATLVVIHTPGHAPDHLCLLERRSRTLFTGDLLVKGGTVVIPSSRGGNLSQYLESLRRILSLTPVRALPAHGPPIEDPVVLILEYLAHRQMREQQVLTALRSGRHSVDAIADRIYGAAVPAVSAAARESVLAHLIKLEEDGLAKREADAWWPDGGGREV